MKIRHHAGEYDVSFVSHEQLHQRLRDQIVLTDTNVAESLGLTGDSLFAFEAGETQKHLGTYVQCVEWLIERRVPRSATIYAVGGGVVGDLVGFVASTYMRGINFVQVPTTLLSMVDSSVGGKVGIDHGQGKNILGAFKPPSEVLVCVDLLRTLPPRQVSSGLAEVLKYGFIFDPSILQTYAVDEPTIRRCIEIKAHVVENDEFETNGLRAILNFGHTVGHALESATNYSELLHGEAIAIGMCVEAKLSEMIGLADSGVYDVVRETFATAGLPVTHPLLQQPDLLIDRMKLDKKRTGAGLAFSLLSEIGKCKLIQDVPAEVVKQSCLMV